MKLMDIIKESLEPSTKSKGTKDIVTTFQDKEHYKWFDYLDPNFKINPFNLELGLKYSIQMLVKDYGYKLKRVVIKDKGQIVAFLIYTNQGSEKLDDIGDGKQYPVLITTAVHPDYRNKGLLKMMLEKSELIKPFLVHTGPVTPPGLWGKIGCSPVKELMDGNVLMKCE